VAAECFSLGYYGPCLPTKNGAEVCDSTSALRSSAIHRPYQSLRPDVIPSGGGEHDAKRVPLTRAG